MIKHIVFWKIRGSQEERSEHFLAFREKAEYLKSIIPEIQEATVACNIHSDGFDICIDSVFRSMEELEIYIQHPEHLKVRAFLDSIQYEKIVFDYEF